MGVLTKCDQIEPIYLPQSVVTYIYLHPVYVRSKFVLGVKYICSQYKKTLDIKYIRGRCELLLLATCSRSELEPDIFSLSANT
jgi:hypothetical protein